MPDRPDFSSAQACAKRTRVTSVNSRQKAVTLDLSTGTAPPASIDSPTAPLDSATDQAFNPLPSPVVAMHGRARSQPTNPAASGGASAPPTVRAPVRAPLPQRGAGAAVLNWLRQRRNARYVTAHPLPEALWANALSLPALSHLDPADHARLRPKVQLLLRDKSFYGAHGFAITQWMRLRIATEACLPTLNIDADCYAGFHTIVVYETAFIARHRHEDDIGVVHESNEEMSGESWDRGPVILSWQDIETSAADGNNLVLHEFAHKLDLGAGDMNGCPPLRSGMTGAAWRAAFAAAYAHLCRAADAGRATGLDAYAAEDPAEFFAVAVEAFFMQPRRLLAHYPDVYAQLLQWLAQDPYNPGGPSPTPARPDGASLVPAHPKPRRTPATRRGDRADDSHR